MVKKTSGTKSPMNIGAFKRVFGVLVVLLLVSALIVGAASAKTDSSAVNPVVVTTVDELVSNITDTSKQPAFIQLADNFAETESFTGITIGYSVTIDGNGKTITVTSGNAITLSGAETIVTLNNLNVTSKQYAAVTTGGVNQIKSIVIDGGTYISPASWQGAGTININVTDSVSICNTKTEGAVHINGPVKQFTISGNTMSYSEGYGSGLVAGFVFFTDDMTRDEATTLLNSIKKSNTFTYEEDGDYGWLIQFAPKQWQNRFSGAGLYTTGLAEAKIGDLEYYYLSGDNAQGSALNAAEDGDTVKLLKPITLTEQLVIEKNITFDGNDKQITIASPIPTDGAIKVNATGEVTLQNLDITATNAGGNSLIDAFSENYPANPTDVPQKLTITNSKLNVDGATGTYAVIKARPVQELTVTGSEITAEGSGTMYAVWFIPQTDNAKSLNVEDNKLNLESTATTKTTTAFAVTISGNTTGLTATIDENDVKAKSSFRAGLLDYTAQASNAKTTLSNNKLELEADESYVQKTMISNTASADITTTVDVNGNTADIKQDSSEFYVISVAQRANSAGAGSYKFEGTIDNEFTGVTEYIHQITDNIDQNNVITLDKSTLTIVDNTKQPSSSSSSSSSGSSVWLTETPTPTPTQTATPTETVPTDTVPTDIPVTQPTEEPSSPGFGILAVLAGLGTVAVLRRK